MTEYLSYQFEDTPEFVQTYDELPFWSAPFGLLLLKYLELRPHLTVIDIGSGAGFPLLELAGRLGKTSKLYGLDPWSNANQRAKQKIKNYGLTNVEIMECSAAEIPLEDDSVDLIVSNLGINNFENPDVVFAACHRVLKPQGKLALTTNLNGHWQEFYDIFQQTLFQLGKDRLVPLLQAHQAHRGTVQRISQLFTNSGFQAQRCVEEHFTMNFLDGSAFLNHPFIKLGWLTSWKNLLPPAEWQEIFGALEQNLNTCAAQSGMLTLTVPMAFMEGAKK